MIPCFFYRKIDSAVPYNSALHLGILNIQYMVIRANINLKSLLMLRPNATKTKQKALPQTSENNIKESGT